MKKLVFKFHNNVPHTLRWLLEKHFRELYYRERLLFNYSKEGSFRYLSIYFDENSDMSRSRCETMAIRIYNYFFINEVFCEEIKLFWNREVIQIFPRTKSNTIFSIKNPKFNND